MAPHIFDLLPLIDSLLAENMRNSSCESLDSVNSSILTTSTESDIYTELCASSADSIHTMATTVTQSTTRPPSLVIGGARRGPRKHVSFSPSVTARETMALDLAGDEQDDDDEEELGADLSSATRAEKAIYKHTLRCKGMAAARDWWEAKLKEKKRLARRSHLR